MKRSDFLKTLSLLPLTANSMNIAEFNSFTADLPLTQRMPVLFVGHGSPMNAIETNGFTKTWEDLGKRLPTPKAVLVISAHWLTRGTHVTAMDAPKKINDFGGFPRALSESTYPAKGNPQLAGEIKDIIKSTNVGLDHDWGLDHGAWSVLKQMYPDANIPVLQLSIDYYKPAAYHYDLAKQLSALRDKGVLILGSGNMVHNLRMVAFDKMNEPNFGFDWAKEANGLFKKNILDGNHQALFDYEKLGEAVKLAVPTPDHYYPLIYTLALQEKKDNLSFFNDQLQAGSLSMTSVMIGGV
ncbi:4,5-DOPA-extradiol-dioxygenase [Arcicella aurantiaca]|nr:4,5-DOPA dioxygenase extradiol [Arcicella aurantiaca]